MANLKLKSEQKNKCLTIVLTIMLFLAATTYLYSTDEAYLKSSEYLEAKASILNLIEPTR